jgi:Tfp pilus assembly protein PilF
VKTGPLIALLCALFLGLALRVAYLDELRDSPTFAHPEIDALYHDYWARGLVTGNWSPPLDHDDPAIQDHPFFKPPGTPYALAALYRVFGTHYIVPRVAFMALGLISGLLLVALAWRILNAACAALAAVLYFTYWGFIYFEGTLLEPALTTFLLLACICLLQRWYARRNAWYAAVAAVCAGLCALVRPNVLLCVPVMGLWLGCCTWRRSNSFKRGLAALVLWGGLAGVAVLPATVRNYHVSGDLVLINSQGGITLHTGNNPGADGYNATTPAIGGWTCFDWPRIVAATSARAGRPLSHAEADAHYAARAWRYIATHPGHTLRLMGRKFLLYWGPAEVANQKEAACDIAASRVLSLLPLRFAHILALSLLGTALWIARLVSRRTDVRASAVAVLIGAVVIVYSLSYLPFQVAGRYRMPVVPFLILGACYAIHRVAVLLRQRCYITATAGIALGIALWFLTSWNVAGYQPRVGRWHLSRGAAFMLSGRTEDALREFEQACKLRPRDERIYANIGVALFSTGDVAGARAQFERALELNTNYFRALKNLGVLHAGQERPAAASDYLARAWRLRPTDFVLARTLGEVYVALELPDDAVRAWRAALAVRPGEEQLRYRLARLYERQDNRRAALHLYQELVADGVTYPPLLNNYAWLLATAREDDLRDGNKAISLAQQACEAAEWTELSFIDTLSAAYAADGQFSNALAVLNDHADLATEKGMQALWAERRKQYVAGEPVREK